MENENDGNKSELDDLMGLIKSMGLLPDADDAIDILMKTTVNGVNKNIPFIIKLTKKMAPEELMAMSIKSSDSSCVELNKLFSMLQTTLIKNTEVIVTCDNLCDIVKPIITINGEEIFYGPYIPVKAFSFAAINLMLFHSNEEFLIDIVQSYIFITELYSKNDANKWLVKTYISIICDAITPAFLEYGNVGEV